MMTLPRVSDLDVLRVGPGFADAEFLAEEYPIEIQPHFNSGEPLRFISQECGAFDRRSTTMVPLWVALFLERHGKCTIKEPSWLTVNGLRQKLKEERERGTTTFAVLDDELIQVAVVLLNRDYLNIEYMGGHSSRHQIQCLLTELLMLRKAKVVEGLKQMDFTTNIVDISNMTSVERCSIRSQSSVILDTWQDIWTLRDKVSPGIDGRLS